MDENRVSQLIESIYTSAFEEDGWIEVLRTLRTEFHASQASIAVFDGPPFAISTLDPVSLEPYSTYYHKLDPGIPINNPLLVQNDLRVFRITDLMELTAWINGEFHNDFLASYDMSLWLASFLGEAEDRIAYFVVHRPVGQQNFNGGELSLLATLAPHLNRGMRIYREMEGLRTKAGLFAEALDAHGAAILMLDALGRVLSLNKAAEQLLTGGQLSLRDGRLMALYPQNDTALQAALRPPQAGVAPAEIILHGPAHSPAVRLSITPVNGSGTPLFFDVTHTARVAFVVHATTLGPSTENLITGFGLTRAEAEITLLLLQGAKAAQIAALRETSIGTVNTQLKQIYAKLGVSGQVELLVKFLGQ